MPTIAYTALGSSLYINGSRLAQVQIATWDHTLGRLRVRIIHWAEDDGQELVRGLQAGAFVDLRLETPDKIRRECKAVIRFCRTRMTVSHVIRTTVEFILDKEQFSRIINEEKKP